MIAEKNQPNLPAPLPISSGDIFEYFTCGANAAIALAGLADREEVIDVAMSSFR